MAQIIENFRIDKFRGLQNLILEDLGQVNLLVGINNSGKTSIIEALSIFSAPLDPISWLSVSERRLSRSPLLAIMPKIEMLQWIFPQAPFETEQSVLEISAEGNSLINKVRATLKKITGIDMSEDKKESLLFGENNAHWGAELEVIVHTQTGVFQPNIFQFWENERFRWKRSKVPQINTEVILPFYASAESFTTSRLTKVIKEGMKDEVLEVIRWLDPDIKDLQILAPSKKGPTLNVEHTKLGLAPLHIFGDGLRRLLIIALTLNPAKDGILLIDEIETAIHISAFKKIFSWLVTACKRRNIQLFATTHSLEAVDAILNTEVDKNQIVGFRLGTENEPAKRYSGELLYRLRYERGLDVR